MKRTLLAAVTLGLVATACGGEPAGEVSGDALRIDGGVVAAQPDGAAAAAAADANAFGRRLHVALASATSPVRMRSMPGCASRPTS